MCAQFGVRICVIKYVSDVIHIRGFYGYIFKQSTHISDRSYCSPTIPSTTKHLPPIPIHINRFPLLPPPNQTLIAIKPPAAIASILRFSTALRHPTAAQLHYIRKFTLDIVLIIYGTSVVNRTHAPCSPAQSAPPTAHTMPLVNSHLVFVGRRRCRRRRRWCRHQVFATAIIIVVC